MNQIREANQEYEKFTRDKLAAATRCREAKSKVISMNRKRSLLEQEIEQYEKDYQRTKSLCDYKVKIHAANCNMQQKEEATADAVATLETKLYQAKNILSTNTMKHNSLLSEYKEIRKRVIDARKKKYKADGYNESLTNDLKEMQTRAEVLQERHAFREQKKQAVAQQMEELVRIIEDAETRTMLAEQYHISLETHRDAIMVEIGTMRAKRFDAMDKVEEIKRLRAQLMRKHNISHPSQLLKR